MIASGWSVHRSVRGQLAHLVASDLNLYAARADARRLGRLKSHANALGSGRHAKDCCHDGESHNHRNENN